MPCRQPAWLQEGKRQTKRSRMMHASAIQWLERFLVLSVVLSPILAVAAGASATPLASPPRTWPPGSPIDQTTAWQNRSASQPSSALETKHKRNVRVPAGARKPHAGIPARYTNSEPRALGARPIAPHAFDAIQHRARTKPNLFIGPTQESRKSEFSSNLQTELTIAPSYASLSSLFPRNHPFIALNAVPQLSANESYRMNQATHEILHGGN